MIIKDKIIEYVGFDPEDYEDSLNALKVLGYEIIYIHLNDKKLLETAVKTDPGSVAYIKKPSLEIQKLAIKNSNFKITIIAMCPNWKDLESWVEKEVNIKNLQEEIINHIGFNSEDLKESIESVVEFPRNIIYIHNDNQSIKNYILEKKYCNNHYNIFKKLTIEEQKKIIEYNDFNIEVIARCPNWRDLEEWIEKNSIIKNLLQ